MVTPLHQIKFKKIIETSKHTLNFWNFFKYQRIITNIEQLLISCVSNYLKVLYNIPTGFKLTAAMTTNYRQLKTIYAQRRTHRLPEWREFCKWIETLPHAEFIIGGEAKDE